jgi:hypothetical protein
MSLFTVKPKEERKVQERRSFRTLAANKLNTATAKQTIDEVMGAPVMGETIHIASLVNWSLHDLIAYLLDFTGPATVHITTWAVSENPVRIINQLVESGLITELNALLDRRIKSQCPQAFQLIKGQWKNVSLVDIHAKVGVIMNEEWAISITSTANLTNKQRIEKYVVCCDRHIAEKEILWIEKAMEQGERLN